MRVAHNPRHPVRSSSPLFPPVRGRGARLNEQPSVKTTRTVERFSMFLMGISRRIAQIR